VTRVEPEVYVPPKPGAPVYRATGQQRDEALYFDEMGDQKVPVGFGRDGNPVYLNFEFVDGTRGAHISISGVSGIATKTSFALFLLHSIVNSGVLKTEAHNTKMLVFSVNGEDLLFLDYANARLNQEDRDKYSRLGLPATPFQSGTPDVQARDKAISRAAPIRAEVLHDRQAFRRHSACSEACRRVERHPTRHQIASCHGPASSHYLRRPRLNPLR
jgi:DNA helicase HerA-like ATPase